MIKHIYIIIVICLAFHGICHAEIVEHTDSLVRLNPNIDFVESTLVSSPQDYPYINYSQNAIIKNGADWHDFYNLISDIDSTTINIVHIGDSHLQADIMTGHLRELLQNRYGNAGRGLIIPFKMANTNEPRDYSITSSDKWTSSKITQAQWINSMGFTGISITPNKSLSNLKITTKSRSQYKPFNALRLYKQGNISVNEAYISNGDSCQVFYDDDYIDFMLNDTTSTMNLNLCFEKNSTIWGFDLSNDTTGIVYNTIGNNGATYENYNRIPKFSQQISMLIPDLIIISLGANEAFSNITPQFFRHSIHVLVSSLQYHNPQAQILLVTPMECQRRKYIRRNGRRRSRTYVINERIQELRNIILDYAADNNIAVYDWYKIGGGNGASTHWVEDNLLSHDRIHNTAKGYELQGKLFYEALINDILQNQ